MLKVTNGNIYMEDGRFHPGELVIGDDHRIISVTKLEEGKQQTSASQMQVLDAHGHNVIPGLIDIHIHGSMTGDFSDGDIEGLEKMARYLKSQGITSFCPTSMTYPIDYLTQVFAVAEKLPEDDCYARLVGINMEGPFLSSKKKGAQKEENLSLPDIAGMEELLSATSVPVKLVTIAPELEGSMEFIRHFKQQLHISIGHSVASYEEASRAFTAGADHVTHLYNAMTPWSHREPGIIGASYDNEKVMVELLCDGIHVHPSVVRSTFDMFSDERVILISDSMRAAGMEDGDYDLGGQHVIKRGRRATLEDGTIAGSATNLADQMRNAVTMGIPLESVVKAATRNPAKSIGMEQEIGQLIPGARGDILFMNQKLEFTRVIS